MWLNLKPTYEGLKAPCDFCDDGFLPHLKPTYEGLKDSWHSKKPFCGANLKPTYEGLKVILALVLLVIVL